MKFVNWRYPAGKVVVRFHFWSSEKDVLRAVGIVVGESFIGWMKASADARPIPAMPVEESRS